MAQRAQEAERDRGGEREHREPEEQRLGTERAGGAEGGDRVERARIAEPRQREREQRVERG